MRQHLGTHRNGKLKVSDIYKIDEDLRGFFLSKVNGALRSFRDPAFLQFFKLHATSVAKSRTRIGP